jgi:hypothetical protein
VNKATASIRNRYVVDLAQEVLFGMLAEKSSLNEIYQYAKDNNKKILTI